MARGSLRSLAPGLPCSAHPMTVLSAHPAQGPAQHLGRKTCNQVIVQEAQVLPTVCGVSPAMRTSQNRKVMGEGALQEGPSPATPCCETQDK